MATLAKTAEYIAEQAAGSRPVTIRKMFGEYALYCDGKVVALICDDQLFVKPTCAARERLGALAKEGAPYPGARPHLVVPPEMWDDVDWMAALVSAVAADLPVPPPRRPRAKRPKSG